MRTAATKNGRKRKETDATTVSPSDVALRAFEFYRARGGQPGSELDDWLRAERELAAAAVPQKPRRRRKDTLPA